MGNVKFRCPHCGRKLEADERGAGLEVRCPDCIMPVTIPSLNGHIPSAPLRRGMRVDISRPTILVSYSSTRLLRKYRELVAGWICLGLGAVVALLTPDWLFVAVPLLMAAFFLSMAALAKKQVVNGILLLACTLSAVPFLYPDIMPYGMRPRLREIVGLSPEIPPSAAVATQEAVAVAAPEPKVDESRPVEPAVEAAPAPAAPEPAASASEPVVETPRPQEKPPVSKPTAAPARVAPSAAEERRVARAALPFSIYKECDDRQQPYCPSGWMGNYSEIEQDDCWKKNPHSGRTCIRATYNGKGRWAGVVWQDPPNNWGDEPGGYDLTGATKVTLWARGETGREDVEFKAGLLGANRKFQDTARVSSGKIHLTPKWQKYTVSLANRNLGQIISGFVWVVEGGTAPVTFYLDDIQYE